MLAAAVAIAVVAGIAAIVTRGHVSTSDFDPKAVGESETRMWRAYYLGDELTLGRELSSLQRNKLHVSQLDALRIAEPLARAASTFAGSHGDYERDVLSPLTDGYARIAKATGATWRPEDAARAELAWWVARRTPGQGDPANVGRLIADLYALLYGKRNGDIDRAGLLRAEAAHQRDEEADRGQPNWPAIEAKLVESYVALRKGVSS